MVRLFDDVKEIYCLILTGRCSSSPKKEETKRNWVLYARSKVPKFDYFDSKLFNFYSLFLIKLFKNLSGKTKVGILLSEPLFFFLFLLPLSPDERRQILTT